MRKHKSEFVSKLSGFYKNRSTGAIVSAIAVNKQGNAYKVVYRDMVKVGRYYFSEGLHAMEQTEFKINFAKVRRI